MGAPADVNRRLRRLPKVDEVLRTEPVQRLLDRAPRWAVVDAIRGEIEAARARLLAPEAPFLDEEAAGAVPPEAIEARALSLVRPSLVRVLNATGVVLHTNLGRAPLAARAIERLGETASGYANLEYRIDERRRGSRHEHVAELLAKLGGAEASLVVNNGAAAVLLALGALAAGREVIVSRGELVEIGGSFRVPDVLRASGARLVEVGTTNRTHLRDYERAITADTAVLLKVHQSNFAMVGFTAEVSVAELAALGRARGLVTMVDLGSGSLLSTASFGLPPEPTLPEVVAAGADVVTCSGDKLLGGPQAGLIVGRAPRIEAMRTHPLLRAVRPGRLVIAALEATLELYRDGRAEQEVPAVAMLKAPEPVLRARAADLARRIRAVAPHLHAEVVSVEGAVGGGALPQAAPRSHAVAVRHPRLGPDDLEARLRAADPPLVARIGGGVLLLDVRTLGDDELDLAARAFTENAMPRPASETDRP